MKLNKKILMFGLPLLMVGLVIAIGCYALFSVSFNVSPSIAIDGNTTQELGEVFDGATIEGTPITLTNNAPTLRELKIVDDAPEGIVTSYIGSLSLTKKDTSTWEAIEGTEIEIGYTIVGENFEVTNVPTGHTLIYYKDDESNADDAERLVTIGEFSEAITENLPHPNDWNWGELADYCDGNNGFDYYNQCKGAKLWIVPTEDIVSGELTWSDMANYYYETDLIQYNSDGEITLYPGASLTLTPIYEIGAGVSGPQTITTEIQ